MSFAHWYYLTGSSVPAVHQQRTPVSVVLGLHSLTELQHGRCILWHTMIRPGCVVVLGHVHWVIRTASELRKL